MFVVIGACLAGLYLILKELIPLIGAWNSGVIRTRGYRPVKVARAVEPERFKGLCRQYVNRMGLGFLAIAFGICWAFFWLLALIPAVIASLMLASNARRPRQVRVADTFE